MLDPSLSVHPLFASHRRDSSVEIEERYERVVSASLRALSSMVDVFAQQQAVLLRASGTSEAAVSPKVDTGSTPGKQQQQQQQQQQKAAQQQLQQLWDGVHLAAALPLKPGFFKAAFGSSSAVVRASAYAYVFCATTHFHADHFAVMIFDAPWSACKMHYSDHIAGLKYLHGYFL